MNKLNNDENNDIINNEFINNIVLENDNNINTNEINLENSLEEDMEIIKNIKFVENK